MSKKNIKNLSYEFFLQELSQKNTAEHKASQKGSKRFFPNCLRKVFTFFKKQKIVKNRLLQNTFLIGSCWKFLDAPSVSSSTLCPVLTTRKSFKKPKLGYLRSVRQKI